MRSSVSVLAHCDWSIKDRKRWMSVAVRHDDKWRITPPEFVGEPASLLERLTARARVAGSLVIGFDFPIGIPAAYGRATGLRNFKHALTQFGAGDWKNWYSVAERPADISIRRPFYPMRPGGTSRSHLIDGLGIGSSIDLLRQCERATLQRGAACALFWTLGGNQVGKGAISGWREIIVPNLDRVALWPFDGNLVDLTGRAPIVLAETYPGDVYHRLGISRRNRWSKASRSDRQRVGLHILDWLNDRPVEGDEFAATVSKGFGDDSAGEDRFDAAVGLLGMIDVVEGYVSEAPSMNGDLGQWEGWILGQSAPTIP